MAAQVSFWQRVGSLFRTDSGMDRGRQPGALESSGRLESSGAGPLNHSGNHPEPFWRRPAARSAQARETALRVVELAEAMQQHFRQQDQRAAELAGSLDRVGGTLEQLAAAQRAHGEYLRSIAEHTDSAGKNAAALTATLGRVPESLLAQAEAIRTVARHLEIAQESDTQLMHSLQQFGRAVDTLGSSGTAQVEVLQRLHAAQREQQSAMTALVREQTRRYLIVLVITGVLALGALAALITLLVLRWLP